MGNELSSESVTMLSNLLEQSEPIKYKDVNRFWKHISFFSIAGNMTSKNAFRLLKNHNGPLTTCQLSWLKGLISQPYDEIGLHVLYTYPAVKELFIINGVMNDETPIKSVNDDYDGTDYTEDNIIYQDFPELKTKRDPTLEEVLLLGLFDGSLKDFYRENASAEVDLILSRHLLRCSLVEPSFINLGAMLDTAKLIDLDQQRDKSYIDQIFASLRMKLVKLFCGANDLPKEMWLDIFKYMFSEHYLYNVYKTTPEYTSIVFMGGSLSYLIGYPIGANPSNEQLLKDTLVMFGDLPAHQQRIRDSNRKRLTQYADTFPYPVEIEVDENLLDFPTVEVVFYEEEGKIKATNRTKKTQYVDVVTQVGSVEFNYGKLVDKNDLCSVTELINKMKTPGYFDSYLNREDHTR